MKRSLAAIILVTASAVLAASSPDGVSPRTFKGSPDYATAPRGALLDQFDLYAKMAPATLLGQTHGWTRVMGVQGKDDSAWLWADPAYNTVPPVEELLKTHHLPHTIGQGDQVAVYFIGKDGHEVPLETSDPYMRSWEAAVTDPLTQVQAVILSDNGSTGNGFDFPLAHQVGGMSMAAMIASSEAQFDQVVKNRVASQSPEAIQTEKALFEQEKASLGEVEAKKRADARHDHIQVLEEALLRRELVGGIQPQTPRMTYNKAVDKPLVEEALKRRADMAEAAAKDLTPIPNRAPWVLVAYFQGTHEAGNILFPKSACTGELVLFHDGKPMLAARQTTLVSARTAGVGSAMSQNGGALGGTLRYGLDEAGR